MVRENKITPKRGDVFIVNFDPTIGSEINKARPALILQNNIANNYSPVTIVAALTSHNKDRKLYPTEVLIKKQQVGLDKDSIVLLNQIRSIDKRRLIKKIGKVSKGDLSKINQALKISLGIIDLSD